MAFIIARGNYHPVSALMHEYLRGAQLGPVVSGGKAAENAKKERERGWRDGVAVGIAAALNAEIFARYAEIDMVEAIDAYMVEEVLTPYLSDYWKPRNGSNQSDRDAFQRKMDEALDKLMALAINDKRAEANLAIRKKVVLTGGVAPTEEDLEWLTALRDEENSKVTELDRLVRSAEGK